MSLPSRLGALKSVLEHTAPASPEGPRTELLEELTLMETLLSELEETEFSERLRTLEVHSYIPMTSPGGGRCPICGRGG